MPVVNTKLQNLCSKKFLKLNTQTYQTKIPTLVLVINLLIITKA